MAQDALAFWDAIKGKIEALIGTKISKSMQCERYEVTTAPDGSKIGVTLPEGTTEISIPYSEELRTAKVGDTVLVVWYNSLSNAKAYYYGDGYRGSRRVLYATYGQTPYRQIKESYDAQESVILFNGNGALLGLIAYIADNTAVFVRTSMNVVTVEDLSYQMPIITFYTCDSSDVWSIETATNIATKQYVDDSIEKVMNLIEENDLIIEEPIEEEPI